MDVALCSKLFHCAEQNGATRVIILEKGVLSRSDVFDSEAENKIQKSAIKRESSTTFIVEVQTGFASFAMKGEIDSGFEDLCEEIQNLCQAAKMAHAWQSENSPIDDIIQRFQTASPAAFLMPQTCAPKTSRCAAECFTRECLEDTSIPLQPAASLIAEFAQLGSHRARCEVRQKTSFVIETLYQRDQTLSLQYDETTIQQTIRGDQCRAITLPEYRFDGLQFSLENHPSLTHAQSLIGAFDDCHAQRISYKPPSHGMLVSAWTAAVLGHEASHFHVDVTRAGRLIMDVGKRMEIPNSLHASHQMSLEIALERSLTREKLMERLPDGTLNLDAPVGWMRDGESIDVKFGVVAEIVSGKISRYFEPIIVRFDLRKIWYYAKWAAKPYGRISLKCQGGEAYFQAPWIYFDLDVECVQWT